jgi:hypothetical protein
MMDCGVHWGAAITEPCRRPGDCEVSEWTVTVESEHLSAPLGDSVLGRFADAAGRLVPGGAMGCARTQNRLALTLTVRAPGADEAADSAAFTFGRALAATLWPRYQPSSRVQRRIRVARADASRSEAPVAAA